MGGREEREGRMEEAEAVVVGKGEKEAEEERGVMVRWERFLPRMPVRVLLVEGDDSTRQIIAALLRKCSYRVAATSDGLKAWDILKEKPQSIDLVLTEVDLPSISGFGLLTMIMDHETCNNIPVIMMSSHDSVSMVFKCMLKGAADFLIKPIRKNELRNLWQHVWRRQIVTVRGGMHEIQDKCDESHNLKSYSGKEEHSTEYVAIMQANKECSKQGSDAQSSCTRSDMEAESTHKQLELRQPKEVDASIIQTDGENIQINNTSFSHENAANAASKNVDVMWIERMDCNNITNETNGQKCHHDKTSKDLVDLIRVIDNQPQDILQSRGRTTVQSGFSDIAFCDIDVMGKYSPTPHLELSLERYKGMSPEKQDSDESNVWNHSSSSAFSLYNSRTIIPTLLRRQNLGSESKSRNFTEPPKYQGSSVNMEQTKSPDVAPSVQDGMAVQCNPLQVIPFTLPVESMSLCSGYGEVIQPMFHKQSGQHFWSTNPSMWLEASIQTNSSHQSGQENHNSVHGDLPDEKDARCSYYNSAQEQEEHMELNEEMHVSSAAGESGSSSICNGGKGHVNSSEYGSVLSGTIERTSTTNIFRPMIVSEEGKLTCEEKKPTDCHMTQREVALNKFRLKRKERCFEKKVRYHSRKLLAEHRPRVKGQFVRQMKLNPPPTLAGAF